MLKLGEASPGEVLTGTFDAKNEGRTILHIHHVDTGCSCATVSLAKTVLRPGEETLVRVTARIKDEGQRLQFHIRFYSGHPPSLIGEFPVQAETAGPVMKANPTEVDFGEVVLGSTQVQTVRLLKPDGENWPADEAIEIAPGGKCIKAEVVRRTVNGGAASLVLELGPRAGLPVQVFQETLVIRPRGSQRGIRVSVRGEVVPKLVVSPPALYFGDADTTMEPVTRAVLVRRADRQNMSRMIRFAAPANLHVEELADARPSPQKRLQITLNPGQAKEDLKDGQILVWLENEAEPVQVRVRIFLNRK
jgi:hypothetical protein